MKLVCIIDMDLFNEGHCVCDAEFLRPLFSFLVNVMFDSKLYYRKAVQGNVAMRFHCHGSWSGSNTSAVMKLCQVLEVFCFPLHHASFQIMDCNSNSPC